MLREAGRSVGIPLVADGRLLKQGRDTGAECQRRSKCQFGVVGMSPASIAFSLMSVLGTCLSYSTLLTLLDLDLCI